MASIHRGNPVAQSVFKSPMISMPPVAAWWPRMLRLMIVLGVIVVAAGFGYLVAKRNPLYTAILASSPLVLAALIVIAPRQELFPLIILMTGLFIPVSLPTGTGSRLVLSLVLSVFFAGLWTVRVLTVEKRSPLQPSPVNVPLIGFIAVTLVSLAWSNVFRDPVVVIWRSFPVVQVAATVVMIMLPTVFLLVANYVREAKWLKALVVTMLLAGGLGLIQELFIRTLPVNTRGLFALWVISLSVGLALFHRQLPRAVRGLLLVLAGGWVYLGFGLRITWLAGWLPGMIALGILVFMRSKKLAVVAALCVGGFIAQNADYYLGTVIGNENQESGVTREGAWQVNWRVTRDHLLFGTGPAGYAAYYMSYFPDSAMATHSNYVDILAETGLVGFTLYASFFLTLAWMGYKLCQRLKGRGDFLEGLANAAFAGTVACIIFMGFGDWLIPFAYTQTIAGYDYAVYNWLFMGTIVVVDRLTAPGSAQHVS